MLETVTKILSHNLMAAATHPFTSFTFTLYRNTSKFSFGRFRGRWVGIPFTALNLIFAQTFNQHASPRIVHAKMLIG